MPEEFNKTNKIVNTTLQPKVNLSTEAESALGEIVSIAEARRLLGQNGQGYMANIPLMIALGMGDSQDNLYRIDYQELFNVFSGNKDRVIGKIRKSYDEVTGMANMSEMGNMQGVKQLSECKKNLIDAINELGEDMEYQLLREVVRLFVQYLQTAYVLIGRQH